MPSYLHESIVFLLRNRSATAADWLRQFKVPVPEHDEIRSDSADLSHLRPAEYRADMVSFLMRGSRKELGIIVEVQLGRDEDKPYTWPAYIANLRARHRCPVCLLVFTNEETVERWAERSIELGPGTRCKPWVIGPSNTPVITELQDAQENVELAILSAVAHGKSADIPLATRIACTAIVALADIDTDRSALYLDLIRISLSENAAQAVDGTMNSLGYEYQSDFARRYFGEGKAEGQIEGREEGRMQGRIEGRIETKVEILLKLLSLRFGPLPEVIQARIRSAQDAQLDALVERSVMANTLEQALDALQC